MPGEGGTEPGTGVSVDRGRRPGESRGNASLQPRGDVDRDDVNKIITKLGGDPKPAPAPKPN